MSRYGAASTSSGTRASPASHLRRISAASVSSKAKLTARVSGQADGLRPVQGAHRGCVGAGDEDPHRERARRSGSSSTVGTSATTTPGSVRSRSLSANSNGCRASSVSARRRNCSGIDDGDEVGLAARQPPDLLEHGVDRAAVRVERLEQRRAVGEVEPARADPGIAAAPRDVDRAEPVRRDRPREGERALGRRVEILDDEQRAVAGAGRRRDGGSSGAQAASDPAVVAPHAEHREDEHRDRDRDEPRALGELRPDHDHRDEAGGRRADRVDRARARASPASATRSQ